MFLRIVDRRVRSKEEEEERAAHEKMEEELANAGSCYLSRR